MQLLLFPSVTFWRKKFTVKYVYTFFHKLPFFKKVTSSSPFTIDWPFWTCWVFRKWCISFKLGHKKDTYAVWSLLSHNFTVGDARHPIKRISTNLPVMWMSQLRGILPVPVRPSDDFSTTDTVLQKQGDPEPAAPG